MKHTLIAAAALASLVASAPALASVASEADALVPAAKQISDPYTRGLAEGWLEIATRQDHSVLVSHTYNDAAPKALQNAKHYIDGSQPFAPIYGKKNWGTRTKWIDAITAIERVNAHAASSPCKGEKAGRLSALTDEVWKEQDETHGTHWVHGWAQIERAKKLADEVDAELAACPVPVSADAPKAQPAPLPPKPIQLSADALFDFDKAILKPAGRTAVRQLAEQLKSTGNVALQVTGYTDRFGASKHNLQLSRARAQAVANALVTAGVDRHRITVEGKGAADSTVNCPGRATAAVIQCLAPNRRVEIRTADAPWQPSNAAQ